MVAQVQIVKVAQYVFPEGESVAGLTVRSDTVLKAGVIPTHVTELDMRNSRPIFEEGAIHPALKYLWVYDLVKGSHYPSGLNLFVHTYSVEALPVGPQVFIHANERAIVSKDREHYLFHYNGKIGDNILNAPEYDHGEQFTIEAFGRTIWAVKRTPKVIEPVITTVPEPVIGEGGTPSPIIDLNDEAMASSFKPVPEPAAPVVLDDQTKLIKAKRELIGEKKALIQAKLELNQRRLEILRAAQ